MCKQTVTYHSTFIRFIADSIIVNHVCKWRLLNLKVQNVRLGAFIDSAWLSTWRRLSPAACSSENYGNSADRVNSVNLGGNRRVGATPYQALRHISCNRRMRAVQSGGRELASGARRYVNKERRSSDYNKQRGRVTSFSAQVDITPLYLHIANSCLLLY